MKLGSANTAGYINSRSPQGERGLKLDEVEPLFSCLFVAPRKGSVG